MNSYAHSGSGDRPMASPNLVLSQADFARLSQFVYRTAGITLPPAKRVMVETRLRNRVTELGVGSFHAYCNYVLHSGGESEITPMLDRITTNKTDFFREPAHFSFMTATAVPAMQALHWSGVRKPLTAWSAGCSSGEEPYTLAIVLAEYAETQSQARFRYAITATDISTRMLEKAREATYSMASISPIPESLRRRYLLRSSDRNPPVVRICRQLRSTIQFRQLNLLDATYGFDAPFDLILCRNVMIYFDRATQQRVVDKFISHLRPGGYLFLGHSESLNGLDTPLGMVAPSIYRRPS